MKKILFALILLQPVLSSAQKQGNMWCFGTNAGLDFNSGSPVPFTTACAAFEGSASIADNSGRLMFYTEGFNLRDSNDNVMPNGSGLMGGGSATMAAVAVPIPGSSSQYYVFTLKDYGSSNSLFYNVVDMTLNGGLGDITLINQPLIPSTVLCEKLCATYHPNKQDIWVVVKEDGTDAFYSFLVTASGINPPIISHAGIVFTTGQTWIGYMKFNPLGTKIAATTYGNALMELLDFDKTTGIVSNGVTYLFNTGYSSYGVEFSASGGKLYINNVDAAPGQIYQFDMSSGNNATIVTTGTLAHTYQSIPGALQIGPDKKIYYVQAFTPYLGVINDPEAAPANINAQDSVIYLGSGNSCGYGLPNFISDFFSSSPQFENTCFGDTTYFSLYNTASLFAAQWNFDDPLSGTANNAFIFNTTHYFTAPGTYNVQLIQYFISSAVDTSYITVTIDTMPFVNLGPDTTFCTGSSYLLQPLPGYGNYLWQDGSTDSIFNASLSGNYYVTVKNGTCAASDTVTLTSTTCASPNVNFASSDTVWCDKKCVDFFDVSTNSPTSWKWYFPGAQPDTSTDQNPSNICYNNYGNFNVTLVACNAAGCDSITIPNFINEYHLPSAPVISLQGDTLLSTSAYSYQWYLIPDPIPGATGQSYVATQPGSYYVLIHDSIGCEVASNIIAIAGIHNLNSSDLISVYPNPNNGFFSVVFNKDYGKNAKIKIINRIGQVVFDDDLIISKELRLDLNSFSSGIYLLQLTHGDKSYISKFMIEK